MADISIYTTTFNPGRTPPAPTFSKTFFSALAPAALPPDLVVLSLQELAPLAYAFLGGAWLAPYFRNYVDAINAAAGGRWDGVRYHVVSAKAVGMIGILVLVREEVQGLVRWVRAAGVGTGVVEMGNKGAVGVRMGLQGEGDGEVVVTFVAAHLAAMEWEVLRRNLDWRGICEGMVFERQDGKEGDGEREPLLGASGHDGGSGEKGQGLYVDNAHLFIAGDLNYRTSDTAPGPDDYKTWPQAISPSSPSEVEGYAHLLPHDQLTRERKANRTLHHLSESSISFPPTYKYSSRAQKVAASPSGTKGDGKGEGERWLWARHRTPSWCDRILYLAALPPPKVHAYTALPVQPTSDHRPVVLCLSIPRRPVSVDVKAPFPVRKDWREARARARRFEYVVGVAAYLGLTWEGEALLAGTVVGLVGGYLVLTAMIGG